jgi:hypothetical protein
MNIIKKSFILEGTQMGNDIRTVVRDIIQIFKNEDEGEFYLPEEINDNEPYYEFKRFNLSVELIIQQSDDVDDFLLNGELYRDEGIVVILIVYNPENKNKLLYDLVGELNELVAHELRHLYQQTHKNFNLDVEEPEDPFEYYSQPHEIDAQIAGFKRMSKITKKPFDQVVRNWFEKNKDIHRMNDDEREKIIQILLNS